VDHVCDLPGAWLDQFALATLPGNGANALSDAATEWNKKARKQECFDHFWDGPDDLENADMCQTGAESFFVHADFEPSYSVTNTGSTVSDLKLTFKSRMNGIEAPPSEPDTCTNLKSNDQAPPFAGLGSSEPFFFAIDSVPFDVDGPTVEEEEITGEGEFSVSSFLQTKDTTTGSQSQEIVAWDLFEDGVATFGTSSMDGDAEVFRLRLMGPHQAYAATQGQVYWKKIPAGEAAFDAIARIDGVGYHVRATNSTDIRLLLVAGGTGACLASAYSSCWFHEGFSLEYEDSEDRTWTLEVPETYWGLPL
jgi:hypothetical protein